MVLVVHCAMMLLAVSEIKFGVKEGNHVSLKKEGATADPTESMLRRLMKVLPLEDQKVLHAQIQTLAPRARAEFMGKLGAELETSIGQRASETDTDAARKPAMSAGKENWLAKQEMKASQKLNKLSSTVTEAPERKPLPQCVFSSLNTSEVGEWSQLPDRTSVYNLKQCDLHDYQGAEARHCLANKHLIFVGDSITRYQYLSLVQMIESGQYVSEGLEYQEGKPSILREHDFGRYYKGLRKEEQYKLKFLWESKVFGGNENCDCWRGNSTIESALDQQIENRYFQLPGLNLYITYLRRLGPNQSMQGHLEAAGAKASLLTKQRYDQLAYDQSPLDFKPKNLVEAVEGVLEAMPERKSVSTVLIWNDGVWGWRGRKDTREEMESLVNSVGVNGKVLWKSTTVNHFSAWEDRSFRVYDKEARQAVSALQEKYGDRVGVYDTAAITSYFEKFRNKTTPEYQEVYWDAVHFHPYVYNNLNKALLNQLCGAQSAERGGGAL
jgi:hypothetical protein